MDKVDIKYLGIPNICFSLTDKADKREKKFIKQRIKNGFDDSETWSLYSTIAQFIYPRLKRYKEVNNGTPMGLTENEWNDILDKMIFSFESIVNDTIDFTIDEKENYNKFEEGINLFAKYFLQLWW